MSGDITALSVYLGPDGNFVSCDSVSLSPKTVASILERTGQTADGGEQPHGNHHFFVDIEDLRHICAKRFDLPIVERLSFSSVREAVSSLRDLAKRRGMLISKVVEIDTSDDGSDEGLEERAMVYIRWLGIPDGKLDWPGSIAA